MKKKKKKKKMRKLLAYCFREQRSVSKLCDIINVQIF